MFREIRYGDPGVGKTIMEFVKTMSATEERYEKFCTPNNEDAENKKTVDAVVESFTKFISSGAEGTFDEDKAVWHVGFSL